MFDEMTNTLLSNRGNVDNCIDALSNTIFDISFQINGKTIHTGNNKNKNKRDKKSIWFNEACRLNKKEFHDCKRIFKSNPCDANRIRFLHARNNYCRIKRETKRV